VERACAGLKEVSAKRVLDELERSLYDGIDARELSTAKVLAARSLVELDPGYSFVSARLLLDRLRDEALPFLGLDASASYAESFPRYVARGIELELLEPELGRFDLERLGRALRIEREESFQYLGLQTLYDRYMIRSGDVRFELPQAFFMRVAMGLAVREI